MPWGDRSGVPAKGRNLIIVGIDNNGLLHIRIVHEGRAAITDTDETELPGTRALVSDLKRCFPRLLPPHVLTGPEKAMLVSVVMSILGPAKLTNQKPEEIAFFHLEHLMGFMRGRCPDPRFHPGAERLWWEARKFILQIPGYEDLERYANSVLKEPLTLEAIDRIRRDAAARRGMRFEEVDLLLVREVADILAGSLPGPEDEGYITFKEAREITDLTSCQLSRATKSGAIKSIGEGRGKLVHELDARKYADARKRRRDDEESTARRHVEEWKRSRDGRRQ
jgi:hypothetical protein